MALVQAVQIASQPQKESVLDKILKGVQLANGLVSTYENVRTMGDKIDTAHTQKTSSDLDLKTKQAAYDEASTPESRAMKKRMQDAAAAKAANEAQTSAPEYISPKDQAAAAAAQGHLGIEREKLDIERGKLASEKGPKQILSKLSAEAQGKVGTIAEGFAAINSMEDAISNKGIVPGYVDPDSKIGWSGLNLPIGQLVPDNQFTKAQRTLNEAVGRLQSGGAIGQEELETFKKMGPRPSDAADLRVEKLNDQRRFLENKLTGYGIKKDDLEGLGFKIPAVPKKDEKRSAGGVMDLVGGKKPPPSRVTVRKGGEILEIDAADLKDAEKDGYKVSR